jgi:hypothetical protein
VCGCSKAACPLAAGVGNALGFSNVPACCSAPCPLMPMHKVTFCLQITERTCAKIQQGCSESSDATCAVRYNWGLVEDTWGRPCRVIKFDRSVARGTFIRIRLCSCDACDSVLCSDATRPQTNKLISFLVDGIDYLPTIESARAADDHTLGCIYVGCQGGFNIEGACCDEARDWTLNDLPFGSEIVFGPIGTALPSVLIA